MPPSRRSAEACGRAHALTRSARGRVRALSTALAAAPYALKRQSRDWTRVDRCISAIQFYFFKVIHWGLGQLNTKTRSVRVVLLWL